MKTLLKAFVTISLLTSSLIGCSKKEGDSASQQKAASTTIFDEPLLQKLPNTTVGFAVLDFAGESYKKWAASPWASDVKGLSALKSAVDELEANDATKDQAKVARTLLDSLQKLGLIAPDGKSLADKVLSSAVVYASTQKDAELPADLGVFVRAAAGASIGDKVATLRQILTDAGLKVTDEKIGDASGFVAKMPTSEEDQINLSLHVAGTQDKLGLAFSKGALEGLFGSNATTGLANLRAMPEFTKAEETVRSPDAPLTFAFLSVKSLAPLFDEQDGQDGEDLSIKDSPVSALAVSQSYTAQMITLAGIVVSPTNEIQKSVLAAFEGSGLPAAAFKLPADTAVSLSLDARILGKLESVLKGMDDPSAAMAVEQLKNVQGVTLGLRSSDGSSPVPDIYLAIDSSARDQVASSVEAGVGLGMMAAGQQAQWLSKDISGNPTRYILTPLGVGVYVSSPKNSTSLVVASSERAVRDLSSAAGSGSSLDTSMSPSLRERVVSTSTAGSLYLNFIQLGNLMDSVKSTMASMMGPNPELDQALDSAQLKRLGIGLGSLSYANGVFKIQSVVERVEAR